MLDESITLDKHITGWGATESVLYRRLGDMPQEHRRCITCLRHAYKVCWCEGYERFGGNLCSDPSICLFNKELEA